MADDSGSESKGADVDETKAQSDKDLLDNLIKDLHMLKCEQEITKVKTSRFFFPSNVEDFTPTELTNTEVSFLKDFLHLGVVNKKTAVDPLKKNAILLLVWPPNIAPSAYADSTFLGGTKKVRTLVFSVSEEVFNKYHGGVSPHEVVAATAIMTPIEDWKYIEAKVMSAFFHMVFDSTSSFPEKTVQKIWKELPTSNLDSVWRQMLFLCCGPYDIGYHIKRMLKRNSVRIRKLAKNSEMGEISLEKETVIEFKIFSTLAEWCRFSMTNIEPLLTTLKEINAMKPALRSKEIMEKICMDFASQVAFAKKFRCVHCPYQTNHSGDFADHLRMHTGERPYICKVCGATFTQSGNLINHMVRHRKIPAFNCNICGRPFTTRPSLMYHLSLHQKKGTLNYQCYACKKEFSNEELLKEHMPSHLNDLRHKCNICPKKFTNRIDLQEHKSLHDVKRPHKCNKCEKTYTLETYLLKHLLVHNPDKCFSCDYCGMTFRVNHTRMVHIFRIHEKDQIFNEREDLKRAAAQPKAADVPFKMEVDE